MDRDSGVCLANDPWGKFQGEFSRYLRDMGRSLEEECCANIFSDPDPYNMAISNRGKVPAVTPGRWRNQNAGTSTRYINRYGRTARARGVNQTVQDEDSCRIGDTCESEDTQGRYGVSAMCKSKRRDNSAGFGISRIGGLRCRQWN